MTEHRIAPCNGDFYPVDVHPRGHAGEVDRIGRDCRPQHEGLLLGIVGQREGQLAREVAAGLDNLERREKCACSSRDGGRIGLRREVARGGDADFVLEAGGDEVGAEKMPGLKPTLGEQAAETGSCTPNCS